MAYERKHVVGNAAPTTLSATIDNDDLEITIANGTNWPTGGALGKFVVTIARNTAGEEKILCSSRTGNTITIASRGHDGTTPLPHTAGVAVEHTLDAETIDQVNRLANLLTTKGDIYAHNGVNPVRLGTGAVDATTDEQVLKLSWAAPTGLVFGNLITLFIQAGAPLVAGPIRMWYDTTNKALRPSDGSSWLIPVPLPNFASAAARNSYFGTPSAGHACHRSDLGFTEYYTGTKWKPVGRARFTDTTARDAYFTAPDDGDQAYLTAADVDQVYRQNEWVTTSHKVTIAATQPVAGMVVGDLWLQPVT